MTFQLNPDFFVIESDDKIKMRECVPQRKMQRTMRNIGYITKQNADVNDFLPKWVTEEYLSSLHDSKETKNCDILSLESGHIKSYVQGIVERAQHILQEEEEMLRSQNATVKMEDVPSVDDIVKRHKDKMAAVHEELLIKAQNRRDLKRKNKRKDHVVLKKMQDGLILEDGDDFFIPRQLFLFNISTFKPSPQIECPESVPATETDVREPSPSPSAHHPAVAETVTRVTPGKGGRSRSWKKRVLKFFGFK